VIFDGGKLGILEEVFIDDSRRKTI
ncbi:hypothetical protein Tco_1224664, partial [Tanacetum coccineum]